MLLTLVDVTVTPVIVIFVQFPSTEITSEYPDSIFVNVQFFIAILFNACEADEPCKNIALAPSSLPFEFVVLILLKLQLLITIFSVPFFPGSIRIPLASALCKFWKVIPSIKIFFALFISSILLFPLPSIVTFPLATILIGDALVPLFDKVNPFS